MAIEEGEKKMSNGKHWPIGIIISTILIVIACGVTIYIALLQPVQEDGDMMMDYHSMDRNANDVIVAGFIFNKKYSLTYTGEPVSENGSRLSYQVLDKDGNAINDAKFDVILSRPILSGFEIVLGEPTVENGNYTFDNVKVTEKGRWNILARVSIGDDFRHMNLKSNTLDQGIYEYGLEKPMRNTGANNKKAAQL